MNSNLFEKELRRKEEMKYDSDDPKRLISIRISVKRSVTKFRALGHVFIDVVLASLLIL